jgi:hypothetical protein
MDVTQIEKDHGVQFISDMTLADFLKVIDAKLAELDEKVTKYLKDNAEDIQNWKNCSPHEITVITDLHKTFAANMKTALEELKDVSTKQLHKNYTVPSLIVETFVDLARKVSTIHYSKLQRSYVRLA